jgi:hypothetical protein
MKGYQIQCEAAKLMVKIIRFSKEGLRGEIFKFMENEILSSNNFYIKRLYLIFVEELIKTFSSSFLKDNLIVDNILTFFEYSNLISYSMFTCKLLEYLKIIYPLIEDDSKIKFKIFSKLEGIRKVNRDKDKDSQLKEVINIY